jgi:hypothetical protein
MQSLSEDKVTYDEAGVKFVFDFGITDDLQIDLVTQLDGDGTALGTEFDGPWTDPATSNPVKDLQAIVQRGLDLHGRRYKEFVCSKKASNLLLNNAAMKLMIRGSGAPDTVLTPGEVNTLFSLYDLPTVVNYDVVVQSEQADGAEQVVPRARGRPARFDAVGSDGGVACAVRHAARRSGSGHLGGDVPDDRAGRGVDEGCCGGVPVHAGCEPRRADEVVLTDGRQPQIHPCGE